MYVIAIKRNYYAPKEGKWVALRGEEYGLRKAAQRAALRIDAAPYYAGPNEAGRPQVRVLDADSRLGRAAVRRMMQGS